MVKNFFLSLGFCFLLLNSSCNNAENKPSDAAPTATVDSVHPAKDTVAMEIVKKPVKMTRKDSSKCSDIVLQILESSASYKDLTKGLRLRIRKHGGKGLHLYLSASPNPTVDGADKFSEEYEYSLHESSKDHEPKIAGFKFSPKDHLLYQEDIVEGTYKPITYNEKLLDKLPSECK